MSSFYAFFHWILPRMFSFIFKSFFIYFGVIWILLSPKISPFNQIVQYVFNKKLGVLSINEYLLKYVIWNSHLIHIQENRINQFRKILQIRYNRKIEGIWYWNWENTRPKLHFEMFILQHFLHFKRSST